MSDEEGDDQRFGEWIQDQRLRQELSLMVATVLTGMTVFRIREIEAGTAKTGVTDAEAAAFCFAYKLDKSLMIAQILGNIH